MDARELNLMRAALSINRRLRSDKSGYTTQLRSSCPWATDAEFAKIIDDLVASGVARRETGKKRGERIFYIEVR